MTALKHPYPFGVAITTVPAPLELEDRFRRMRPRVGGTPPPPDPVADFHMLTLGFASGFSREVLDALEWSLRRWLTTETPGRLLSMINEIWGTADPFELVEAAASKVWEIRYGEGGVVGLTQLKLKPAAYRQSGERDLFCATVLASTDGGKLIPTREALTAVFVRGMRLIWSDAAESSTYLADGMMPIEDYMNAFSRATGRKFGAFRGALPPAPETPTPDSEFLCPALRKIFAGVPEGVRDLCSFALVTFFRTIGLPRDRVLKIMLEWDSRNTPPLGEDYIRKKVEYHWNRNYTPPGCAWIAANCRPDGASPCPDGCGFSHPLTFYRRALKRTEGREVW